MMSRLAAQPGPTDDALDWAWQQSVSGRATSDGFIPVTSQQWPTIGASGITYSEAQQFRVPNSPTHAGELRDSRTGLKTNAALLRFFP